MKKTSLLKGIVVIVLSIALVASLGTIVFADDNVVIDPSWETPDVVNDTNNTSNNVTNEAVNTNVSEELTNTNVSEELTNNTGTATTTLDTDDANEDNEVNSLAYTGIEDNSVLAIFVVLGAVVAIYSFKKVKEYNNL